MTSLISGGTGLIGALIGFFGALLVSRQNYKAGIEQIRYARAHERRDEVLATLYGLINDAEANFGRLLRSVRRRQDQDLEDQKKQLRAKMLEATGYLRRHFVWIPTRLASNLLSTMEALNDRCVDLDNALDGSDSAQSDGTIKEIAEWLSKEVGKDMVNLRQQIQQVLGIEDSL